MRAVQIGILEPDNFSPEALRYLQRLGKVHTYAKGDLNTFLAPLDVLFIRLAYRIDHAFLRMAPHLRWLCSPTTGHNHINEQALTNQGVRLLSLRGEREFLSVIRATPEHTFGLILALLRRYRYAFTDVAAGHWDRDACRGEELHGSQVGIIGLGRVGYRVAAYCSAFGADIVWCDPNNVPFEPHWRRLPDIASVINASRIVVLCASFYPGQAPILAKQEIEGLSGRYFINTARGELVDEPALLSALKANKLAGAAVDVITDENGQNHLREWTALLHHRNIIVTPHIGGATVDSMARTEFFMVKKLEASISAREST